MLLVYYKTIHRLRLNRSLAVSIEGLNELSAFFFKDALYSFISISTYVKNNLNFEYH